MSDISFLVPSISSPVIGPVTVLARILEKHYSVEIVGPDFGEGICPMYVNSYNYKSVLTPRLYRFPDYIWESKKIADALSGKVVIAVKARGASLPVAMRVKKYRSAKVLAYLDEWDGALVAELSAGQRLRRLIKHLHHPLDDIFMPWIEKLIPRTDGVLSTTTFLQNKFGGDIVHMGVDPDVFKPQPNEVTEPLRKSLNLEGRKLAVFGGVVRPHKGIECVLEALVKLGDPAMALLIVGPHTEHVRFLQSNDLWGSYLYCTGCVPKEEMPSYLALADVIVLPLQDTLLAQSQMPCKVFEAMAMGKPIIGTEVSDLPEVLDSCGWIVPADDPQALADKIEYILDHPEEAQSAGRAAREKCVEFYSKEKTSLVLTDIIEHIGVDK